MIIDQERVREKREKASRMQEMSVGPFAPMFENLC